MNETRNLTRTLGWLGIGLGVAEVLAPERLAAAIGVDGTESTTWIRLMGFREIAVGLGVVLGPRPVSWMQARIAGDLLDTALLARALASEDADPAKVRTTLGTVAGIALLDTYAAAALAEDADAARAWRDRGIDVAQSVTVRRPVEEVYAFWREVENLPKFMLHLESVEDLGEGLSRWVARAPAGLHVAWDAEQTEQRPNERIAWRSLPGSQVDNEGEVTFRRAPGDRGTEIRVRLLYRPPAGRVGALFARLFGEAPAQQVRDDLRAFKQIMEIGEVVRSEASLHRRPHPARPPQGEPEPAPHAPGLGVKP